MAKKPKPTPKSRGKENVEQKAAVALQKSAQRRCNAALKEFNALCAKYRVRQVYVTQIADGQVTQGFQFVSQ